MSTASEAIDEAPTDFRSLIDLSDHGPDTWIGASAPYSWGRIYGGQVVAQALWAALKTVPPDFHAHSMHAYFIRAGDLSEPVRFEVDRLRDGRSFCTRAVVARQSGGAILHLSASFQVLEDEADVQTARMPLAPHPDDIRAPEGGWGWIMDRRPMLSYPGAGKSMGWVRITDPLPDDPRLHLCGIAFTSDTIQFNSARSIHPLKVPESEYDERFMGASLDHAMWFHRPIRADDWHLFEWTCHGLRGGRGMTVGNLFSTDGVHVATVSQEILLRERRPSKG